MLDPTEAAAAVAQQTYSQRVATFTATGDPGGDEPNLTAEQRAALARAISTPELQESIARFNGQLARVAQQITGNQFRSIAEQVKGTIGRAMASQLVPVPRATQIQTSIGEGLRPLIEQQLNTKKLMAPLSSQIAEQQKQFAKALAVPLLSAEQYQSSFLNLVGSTEFAEAMRRVRELSQVELEIPTEDGFDRLAELVESGELDEETITNAEDAIGSNVELSEAIDAAVDEFVKRRPLIPRKVIRAMIVTWVWLAYGGVLYVIAVMTDPMIAAVPGSIGAPGAVELAKKAGEKFDDRFPPEDEPEEPGDH